MFKKLPQDLVIEHFEFLNTRKLGHQFLIPRFTREWVVERAVAKNFMNRAGNWSRAIWALEIMFTDERLRWKSRPSLKACFSDLRYALTLMDKATEENKKKWEKLSQEIPQEDIFNTTPASALS